MTRTLATLAALGVATACLWAADVTAQGQPAVMAQPPQGDLGSNVVYGRVIAIERRSDLVALLTLDDAIQLAVPPSSKHTRDDAKRDDLESQAPRALGQLVRAPVL